MRVRHAYGNCALCQHVFAPCAAAIARKYTSSTLEYEEIRNCLLSIGDNHSYLRSNRDPCDRVSALLLHTSAPVVF